MNVLTHLFLTSTNDIIFPTNFLIKSKITYKTTKLVFIFLFGSLESFRVIFIAFPKFYTLLYKNIKKNYINF